MNKLKKVGVALLSVMMFCLSPSALLKSYAAPASKYYIWFDSEDDSITTIIEGDKVNVTANLPSGYGFDANSPFNIRIGGQTAKSGLIEVKPGANKSKYSMEALSGSAYGNDANLGPSKPNNTTYTLDAQLLAKLSDASGMARQPGTPGDPADPDTFYSMDVASSRPWAITKDSEFTFKATSDEKVDSIMTFSKISGATGEFQNFDAVQVISDGAVTREGQYKVIPIRIDNNSFQIRMAMPANILIKSGMEFTIKYRLQYIEPLTLTVVTPQQAVDDIGKAIANNPTNPSYSDKSKIPFVSLAKDEELSHIANNFQVLAKVERYNSEMHIDWRWEPTIAGDHKDVVEFGNDGRKTRSVTLHPRKEDVRGYLIAKVDYTLKSDGKTKVYSEEIRIEVMILGTGEPPEIKPLTQTVGTSVAKTIDKLPATLDVYNGSVANFKQPEFPYTFTASMVFGEGRGRSEKAEITTSGITPDAITLFIDNSPVSYQYGTTIDNTDPLKGQKSLTFVAKKAGQVTLKFDFYVRNSKNQLVKSENPVIKTFVIKDSTPRDVAELEVLTIKSNGVSAIYPPVGQLEFGFESKTFIYNINLPNKAEDIILNAIVRGNHGIDTQVGYEVTGAGAGYEAVTDGKIESGKDMPSIGFPINTQRTVTLTITAENGRRQLYMLNITRQPPDRDSSLKSLGIYDGQYSDAENLITKFDPKTTFYDVSVSYSTKWLRIDAIPTSLWADKPTYTPALQKRTDSIVEKMMGQNVWIKLTHPMDLDSEYKGQATTTQKIVVQAEDKRTDNAGEKPLYTTTYTVNITRRDPSQNNMASAISVSNSEDRKEIAFADGQKYDKEQDLYYMNIPYSFTRINVNVIPDDVTAIEASVSIAGGVPITIPNLGKGKPILFEKLMVEQTGATEKEFDIVVTLKAESGMVTSPPYTIKVTRNEPDTDSALSSLELFDQAEKAIPAFSFNAELMEYTFNVSYETELLKIVPKARSPLAKVTVDGKQLISSKLYHTMPLKVSEKLVVKVEVYPEDIKALPRVYTLNVTRLAPSNDARLKSLVVNGGTDFKPQFLSSKTNYTVIIPEGTQNVTLTATANHPASTLTLNGNKIESGKPTDKIEPITVDSTLKIEVTAQDGKTKMTYTIKITNENLIEKSNNADLKRLEIYDGAISPSFKSAVTDYNVSVKDETSYVDIIPVPTNRFATVKVFAGTKELGDYNSNYSQSLADGLNEFRVEVTSQDTEIIKNYYVNVYRKDEENQGTMRPIPPESVDFETADNVTVIDISKYPIVSAEIFNNLKAYPDKSIIFQGNDYSLQISGKDIKTLVPHTNTYDFSMTFESPNMGDIWELISQYDQNSYIEPVLVHFKHHGELPGTMILNLSLGRRYRSDVFTWNYYNEERDRIDYYGKVSTNSQGTFSVPIKHMSTYIVADGIIRGSENKVSGSENLSAEASKDKIHPNTGANGGN